ncbi:MAG: PEP/pyruvate-binding domain-containing protein [Thermoplasmata archaeon]
MRYIVDLDKDTRWEIKTIGTKAFNLQKLMILGMRVPSCSVVTTNAYRESHNGRITEPLLTELTNEFPKWHTPIIARSSSVAEDTSRSSKAGVFATIFDVKAQSHLVEAIEKVWSSSRGEDIAVILQEQLEPEIAGVLFTRDPVTGANENVIEYVEGMGEGLVSGKKNPIRVSGKDSRFKELAEEGERLKTLFGYPLDIEWAKTGKVYHILQARPITALPVPPKEAQPTYSMVLAEQFFSGPVSPLFFSLFKFLFEEYYAGETAREVGLDALPKEPLLIRHKDHMYVNTYSTLYLLRKAGGLGNFQQQLKVLPEDIRKEFEDVKRKNVLGALGLLSKIVFLLLKRPSLRKANVDKEFIRKTVPMILSGLEKIGEQSKTEDGMESQYKMLIKLMIQHVRSSKWGLAYCIMQSSLMQRFLEKNHIADPEVKLLALMSGLSGDKTSEGIEELQILADKFKQNKYVNVTLSGKLETYEGYREELVKNPQGRQFVEAFESILFRYGHRRLARDLIEPSWSDEPMIPFNMLRNIILYQDQHNLFAARESGIEKREKVSKEILKQIPVYKRPLFRSNSRYLIRYLAFRESQRFYLDMILSRMRSFFLALGEKMVEEGLIEEKDDIFFLMIHEIEDYLKGGKKDLRYIAAFRRMTFRESPEKPGLYLRDKVDFDAISPSNADHMSGNVIKGEPVSAGTYRGKIKVIETIDSGSSILPGTVLVTKSIDPGQTQVFTSAGGLILEVGGVLSHGAILAREFGIPTVARVNKATNLFHDGQEVLVNGTKGEIVLVEKK